MSEDLVRLSDGVAELVIAPRLGAGVMRYDLLAPNGRTPLFRAAPARAADPFELACNLLIPWSNRVSGGGFTFDGEFHALEPNRPGEPFPIHGNAFSREWSVEKIEKAEALLTLESEGPGPFVYRAEARYALEAGALEIALALTNRARRRLPYGIGLHPWLPRTPLTTLWAPAKSVWLEDARHLPTGRAQVEDRHDWDFRAPRALPTRWINNAFEGWNGGACVHWPERSLTLDITASPPLSTFLLYSPGSEADFFCFEPVSHLVDAFNSATLPDYGGLRVLQPGETLHARCRFAPSLRKGS